MGVLVSDLFRDQVGKVKLASGQLQGDLPSKLCLLTCSRGAAACGEPFPQEFDTYVELGIVYNCA